MSDQPLLDRPVTRRAVLVGGSLAGFAAFLAACGTGGTQSTAPTAGPTTLPTTGGTATPAPSPTSPGVTATYDPQLNWANWCCYLDVDPKDATKWKTLEDFKVAHGTVVNYKEVIDENEGFVAGISNQIKASQYPGWDIITVTDWMVARLVRLRWLEPFNLDNMPNFVANVRDVYKDNPFDKEMKFHAPWQTGMTGIGYDPVKCGTLTSLKALYQVDKRWKGKTEYLTEMRDAIGLTMLALGLDPRNPTRDGCDKAVAAMQKAKSDGIIRDVKGNAYTEDLGTGDAVLCMAWSGDIVTLTDAPSVKFLFPDEGVMFWTDNTVIPKGALHKGTAELMIDYCYVPEHAAQIEAGVAYVTPVKGVKEIFAASTDNTALATDPLRFPPADLEPKLVQFGILSEEDEAYFNEKFAAVIGV